MSHAVAENGQSGGRGILANKNNYIKGIMQISLTPLCSADSKRGEDLNRFAYKNIF
jgi:hypothetical protein